jgi:Fe-S-cluster containining protein
MPTKKKRELPVLPSPSSRKVATPRKLRYDCSVCPAYCCTYEWILVTKRDIQRLARRFALPYEKAEQRFTKLVKSYGHRVLRHRRDPIYKSACQFLDPVERRCTVYEDRPTTCRSYPEKSTCGFYEFLRWERVHQDDPTFIPFRRDDG